MTTINPIVTPQTQAPAFKGGKKKALKILDKAAFEIPEKFINKNRPKAEIQEKAMREALLNFPQTLKEKKKKIVKK